MSDSNRLPTTLKLGHLEPHTHLVEGGEVNVPSDPEPATPNRRGKRDLDDEPYLPDASAGSRHIAQGETSKKRKTVSSLPSYAKNNVIRGIAKIHNEPTSDQIGCVVIGASDRSGTTPSKEVDMDCLKWAWNMEYFSLHFNTRRNIQTFDVSLHYLSNIVSNSKPAGWFWIPIDLSTLNNMHSVYVGNILRYSEIGMTANVRLDPDTFYARLENFQYRLIPLPNMEESGSVSRYTGDFLGPFDPQLVKFIVYPFQDLPPFKLLIPYHFIIVDTGKKLYQLYGTRKISFVTDFPFLSHIEAIKILLIRNIYLAWMKATPDPRWLSGMKCDHSNEGSPTDQMRRGGVTYRKGRGARPGRWGGRGQNTSGPSTAPKPQRGAPASSLAPWDSASCPELSEEVDGKEEDQQFVDDEDKEYSDDEFFEGVKQWASDVWTATRSDKLTRRSLLSESQSKYCHLKQCNIPSLIYQQASDIPSSLGE